MCAWIIRSKVVSNPFSSFDMLVQTSIKLRAQFSIGIKKNTGRVACVMSRGPWKIGNVIWVLKYAWRMVRSLIYVRAVLELHEKQFWYQNTAKKCRKKKPNNLWNFQFPENQLFDLTFDCFLYNISEDQLSFFYEQIILEGVKVSFEKKSLSLKYDGEMR